MIWFWCFMFYSFLGFLLEVVYAHLTRGALQRKCRLVLPICPVYGAGACLIVGVLDASSPPLLLFVGGIFLATAAEYCAACFYESYFSVSFWDYSHLPWNLRGRVCMLFSLGWGVLTIPLVRWLHPAMLPILNGLPSIPGLCLLVTFVCDSLVSALLLRHHQSRDCLAWYRPPA